MSQYNEPSQGQPIRICRTCGKLTPADVPYCLECGAPTPEMIEEQKFARFVQAVFFRKSPCSYIFFSINILIFILMVFAGGTTDPSVLLAFGAKQNDLIRAGEWWRLVTAGFLHIGLIHLAFNNYALWIMGPQLESLYGSARFVVIYLFSGIACSAASCLFSGGVSAGASGSLFGLFGVLAVFVFKYKGEIPEILRRIIQRQVYPLIALNLMLTFIIPQIDKAGHLGGLLAGALAAWALPYSRPGERKTGGPWMAAQILAFILIAASFGAVAWRYDGPRFSLSGVRLLGNFGFWEDKSGPFWQYFDAFNEAAGTFDHEKQLIRPENERLAQTKLPNLKAQNLHAQQALEQVRGFNRSSEVLRKQVLGLLKEQAILLEQFDLQPKDALKKNTEDFHRLQHQWVEGEGKYYGLIEDEPNEK